MFARIISLLLVLALVFQTTAAQGASMSSTTITNENGSLTYWQEAATRTTKAIFVATNGVTIQLSANKKTISVTIGDKNITTTRDALGNVRADIKNGSQSYTQNYTRAQLESAPTITDPAEYFSQAQLSELTEAELSAFLDLLDFSQNSDIQTMRCALNMIAFYFVTGGAIWVCIGSGGLLCLAGIAGAYQSFDATLTACGS